MNTTLAFLILAVFNSAPFDQAVSLATSERPERAWAHVRSLHQRDPHYLGHAVRHLTGRSHEAFRLGLALLWQGDRPKASRAFQDALKDNPRDAWSLSYLGLLESEMGRPDVGERLLQRAVSLMPDHPLPHWFLGQVLYRKGNREMAADEIHKAMSLRRAH